MNIMINKGKTLFKWMKIALQIFIILSAFAFMVIALFGTTEDNLPLSLGAKIFFITISILLILPIILQYIQKQSIDVQDSTFTSKQNETFENHLKKENLRKTPKLRNILKKTNDFNTFKDYVNRDYKTHRYNIYNNKFDDMTGYDFEIYCADILKRNGFNNIKNTNHSNDQGVDIIAEKEGVNYAIQCKCYSESVGNSSIQQVVAGMNYYNCHVGVVLTNSYFTSSAIELAKANNVLLWDRNKLIDLVKKATSNEILD